MEKIQSYKDSMKTHQAVIKIDSDILIHYKEIFSSYLNPFELDLFIIQIMYERGELLFLAKSADPMLDLNLKDQKFKFDFICDDDFKLACKEKYPELFV